MNTREWALLAFTILAQLATGMFVVLMIVRAFAVRKVGLEQASQWIDLPQYVVFPIMGLGLLASLFHLGKLSHIIGAVPNLVTSWMSREVVVSVAFVILVGIYALLQWQKITTEGVRAAIGWLTALVGLVLLGCMSATYMLPAQPSWNSFATPANFYTTALLLGVLGAASALLANYVRISQRAASLEAALRSTLQGLAIAAIVLVGIEFLVLPIYLAYLSTQGAPALHTLSSLVGTYAFALVSRLILVFVGAGLLAAYLYNSASKAAKESVLANLTYSAFVLVLVSEVLGRFLFYATHYRIGI